MPQKCCTAQIVAVLLLASGCGTADLFLDSDVPESPDVADAPYPRIVDTPTLPPAGQYGVRTPDPARGASLQVDLLVQSAIAARRNAEIDRELEDPEETAALEREIEELNQKREELATATLTEAEREALQERARRLRR